MENTWKENGEMALFSDLCNRAFILTRRRNFWTNNLFSDITSQVNHENYRYSLLYSSTLKFIFYCFAGWGYIVPFIEFLTIYWIYHNWIHPLPWSFVSPFPIPRVVSTGVHSISTIFTLLSPFPSTYHCYHHPLTQDLFWPPVLTILWMQKEERKKKKNDVLVCLR
jgi:hypothetical protein